MGSFLIFINFSPKCSFTSFSNAFISMISLTQFGEFDFLKTQLKELIQIISDFYNDFLKSFNKMNEIDSKFYSLIYNIDLSPIAALLPVLIKSTPIEYRFNINVFLPLFHFYLNQKDLKTRMNISESFYLIIEIEYKESKKFIKCENAILEAIDTLSSYKNMIDLCDLFNNSILFFENYEDPIIQSFYIQIIQIVSLMNDLSFYPDEPLYENERSSAILSILMTCIQTKNYNLYPHFSSKLYDLNLKLRNFVEAAETLYECSKIFSWNDYNLIYESHKLPKQEIKIRKKLLMEKSIELFIDSKFYERAYDILMELKNYYEKFSKNYLYLSNITKKLSEIVEKISFEERSQLNRFYGIIFYGNKDI